MNSILEPERKIPVESKCDVLVVGGGFGGVAAALAAARSGVAVTLVERFCALGGLGTIGNVVTYLPLCDGRGRQVLGGIAEELLKVSVQGVKRPVREAFFDEFPRHWTPEADPALRRKGAALPAGAHYRYQANFNPDAAILDYEKLLVDAGVDILYDTRFCAVRRRGGRITHAIVENKSGRTAIACGAVVDASGDADVCFAAGEKTQSLDSNVLCGWYYTLRDGGDFRLRMLSKHFSRNAVRDSPDDGPFFRGDDGRQVSAHVIGSRRLLREHLATLRAADPEGDLQPMHVATYPCFRMTRRLVGAASVAQSDVHVWRDDAVCLANDWREDGPVWAVPLAALAGVANRNLAACGRCMSVDVSAWDALRVIPVCSVTGEAAGVAASMAVKKNSGDIASLDPKAVAKELKRRGNLLSPALVKEAK